MPNTKENGQDCKVCQRLIREKHKHDFVWKIFCIIFAVLALVFAILYFSSGAIVTETTVKIDNVGNNNEITDNSGTVIIGNGGEVVTGTIESVDYTPIICISVILSAVILAIGGIIIANKIQTNIHNNNNE